jgi:hypothetical protein
VHSSAKTSEHVDEAFMDMVKEILPDLSPAPKPPSEQLFLERVKIMQTPAESNKDKKDKCIVS